MEELIEAISKFGIENEMEIIIYTDPTDKDVSNISIDIKNSEITIK